MKRPGTGLRFFRRARLRLQYQAEAAECGLACLAMVLGYYGKRTDVAALRRRFPVSMRGLNLRNLSRIAEVSGLSARPLRLELEELRALRTPAILHWNLDHFVVLEKAGASKAVILDPAVGRRTLGRAEVSRRFTGVAVELLPTSTFSRVPAASQLRLTRFLSNTSGIGFALLQLFLLSAALQTFLLLTPFYSQLVIDSIVVSGDSEFLLLAAIAFCGLALFVAITSGFRSWLIVYIGSTLNLSWSSGLFDHLVRLPYNYFERRHVGDIQSRFGSLATVRELITTQVVESLIDGLMALTTLAVMLVYSPQLAAAVFASLVVYGLARMLAYRPLRSASLETLVHSAGQENHFLETVRGILAIKNFGREKQRRVEFESRVAQSVAAAADASRYRIVTDVASKAVFGVQNVVVVWLAALEIIAGQFTVGMLVAFLAYKAQFAGRAAALIDRLFQFRLARIHLDRLADIVETRVETGGQTISAGNDQPPSGSLAVHDLCYRYGRHEPEVIFGLNLRIDAGEHVAITGPSGVGKSTLLKILVGLLTPTRGDVLLDGRSLRTLDLAWYRRQIGVVMQNDRLLSGSILDNVCFFSARPDIEKADECCRIAGVRDEICKMPMRYYTSIGDMGGVLSGGQQQRLLLARALYRNPKLLFLDEATSHLDSTTESHLVHEISELDITRVLIAHRRETLRHVDRVITLSLDAGTLRASS